MSRRVETKRASRIVREQLMKERRQRRNRLITVGAVALLLVAGLIGFVVYESHPDNAVAIPAGTTNDGGTHAGLAMEGDGPVTVEVYLDLMCPQCEAFETSVAKTLNHLAAEHKIKLFWHPLNLLDGSSTTRYSTRAASSLGCAADAPGDKVKGYGEALYAHQPAEGSPGLTDDQLIDIAGNAGINTPEFAQCVRGQKYVAWVNQVTAQALQRGIEATPTVLVAGKLVPDPTADNIKAAVDTAS